MKTMELLQTHIYPNLDIERLLFDIYIKERINSYSLFCPSCGKKEAYMIKKQNSIVPFISCNRLNNCAYNSSLWDYIKNTENLTNKETLYYLAAHADVDMEDFSYQKSSYSFKSEAKVPKQKKESEPTIVEKTESYYKMELLINKFSSLSKDLQFSTIATFIYRFSLKQNQDLKIIYYKKRGIESTKELGSLNFQDIRALERELLECFDIDALQEFGIYKNDRFKYGFSSFSVIPSFDIYSNLITAIRLRNLNPSKIKEIEVSHGRVSNPLSFGVTKEKLSKYEIFYFTEGHIDALSLGLENFVAVEGVNSFNKKNLHHFKNKKIVLLFDQDEAGLKGAERLATYIKEFGIDCRVIRWERCFGKDINELLLSNNIHVLSNSFYEISKEC